MTSELGQRPKTRYSEITRRDESPINYLGMSLDLSIAGEAMISMSGYVEEALANAGVEGTAKTPATDGLFKLRDSAVPATMEKRAKLRC